MPIRRSRGSGTERHSRRRRCRSGSRGPTSRRGSSRPTAHRSATCRCGATAVDEGGLDMFLVPGARGRGLGPDAARAMADHLLAARGWSRVTVDPYTWNEPGAPRLAQGRLRRGVAPRRRRRAHGAVGPHGAAARPSRPSERPRRRSPSRSGSGTGEPSTSSLRSSSRGCSISCSAMKVVLPDKTELELPDGATGLDAARAIGPKLAEQAVLVRANGNGPGPAPAARGRTADPAPDDARHERPRRALRPPPLVGASARRGRPPPLPGREDRDRPADRERLLLRLRLSRSRSARRTSRRSRPRSRAS